MKNNNKKRFVAIALVRIILFLGGAILINNSEKWSIGYILGFVIALFVLVSTFFDKSLRK
ncbi:hypothetical protein QUD55_03510 [Lactococcus lactis]|uniref:hypothetical protein n=1 Tax=Lactococcus lactis TaxID=1358 RepID=UPI0025A2DD1B|nr:hypothetical protein [Lactococcus lactis]MDM7536546.1 hypothetical protein [Lactococcus lactis]